MMAVDCMTHNAIPKQDGLEDGTRTAFCAFNGQEGLSGTAIRGPACWTVEGGPTFA